MIPELGQFSLILAFSLSILLGTVPIIGAERNNFLWMSLARPLSAGVFVFLAIALALLAYSFVTDDFSVQIVAAQSNCAQGGCLQSVCTVKACQLNLLPGSLVC